MQTFEDFWDKVDNISFRTRESLASESFAAAARPRDQEIERLQKKLEEAEDVIDDVRDLNEEHGFPLTFTTAFAERKHRWQSEIERLRTRLAALEAAVDEVIRIADSGGGKLPHVIWAAIDRLRAARGQHTGG